MRSLLKSKEAIGFAIVCLLLLVVFPASLDIFRLNTVGKYLSFALVALGIVLVWGYGGILSLGQGIFFGIGGYVMAMFLKLEASKPELPDFMVWSSTEALPWWWEPFHSFVVTVAAIIVLPTAFAFLFALVIFKKRVGGVYFAIITLALGLTLVVLLIGQQGYTGGANGITDFKTLLGWDTRTDGAKRVMYFACSAFVILGVVLCTLVIKSRLGKILIAIRDREDRVRFSGYDTAMFKAFVFAVGALFAALGGAFFTLQVGLITPQTVGAVSSIEMVIYAAVGGRTSVVGAVFGALLVGFGKTYFSENFATMWLYLIGGLFIFVVLVLPNGLAGLADRIRLKREA
ncbi:MAG TPA: urea ABC transporter permease subunit UrtC [Burkholderiales bacterium]|nr:urea ABC transporter permease subunit UrtC [Burkholderiales bacterium]